MRRVIRIDGTPVEPAGADIVETEPGVWSVLWEGRSYEARVSGEEIVVNGRVFAFEIEDPRAWKRAGNSAAAHGRASIVAPMPGKVVRVLAAEGDRVEAGQGIVVVEAMKMQNEMKSPRAGVVVSIPVRENDSVNSGALLAAIE
ncbi:MAG TPA: biotin/lipoyl-containing protein [Bryobacteraceae bacterium]|jgi:biotin carboxyl carrier protein|nr:biotin/lipoyl-containing protein [Bryobacteraceae bacterium]